MRIGEGKCHNLLEGKEVTSLAWLWHKPCSISLQPCTRSLRFEKKVLQLLGWDGVTGEVSFAGGFSFKQTRYN